MEWPTKALARVSYTSGRNFALGERVTCVIFRGTTGLERADLGTEEAAEWKAPGAIYGRWEREVKEDAVEERERRRQALESAEEMFLGMMREGGEIVEEKGLLLQFLALMLERKRILRPQGVATGGRQRYTHVRLQQEFMVPQYDLTAERVVALQEQLQYLGS